MKFSLPLRLTLWTVEAAASWWSHLKCLRGLSVDPNTILAVLVQRLVNYSSKSSRDCTSLGHPTASLRQAYSQKSSRIKVNNVQNLSSGSVAPHPVQLLNLAFPPTLLCTDYSASLHRSGRVYLVLAMVFLIDALPFFLVFLWKIGMIGSASLQVRPFRARLFYCGE